MRRPAAAVLAAIAGVLLAAPPAPAPAASRPPVLQARTAFLVQPDTRDVIYARRADERRPMASTAKLMTALVALGRFKLSDRLTVQPYPAGAGESVAGLRAGERMTFADLLRALLLESANDAAHTIAVDASGSQGAFVAAMNRRARRLGLDSTHYSNPIGLDDPGEYSSAKDLVELALLLRRNPFVRALVARPRALLRSGSRQRVAINRNDLVARYAFVDGVKTGHTIDAGYVLVGSARRRGVQVVSAVMGDPTLAARDADTLALLRYGLRRYRRATPVRARRRLAVAKVTDQPGRTVVLAARGDLGAVVRRGERLRVRVLGSPGSVKGPAAAGTRVGTVEVLRRGRVVGRTALVTATAVPRAAVTQRLRSWLSRGWTILLLAALAVCTVLLVLLRRRVVVAGRRGS